MVTQAYVEGVSTRRVEDLVRSLGCDGISKSQVSRICSELDTLVSSFLELPLDSGPYCYLWLDALTQLVREEGRVVQVSVVVATAVSASGKRELLGIDVGTSEDGAFWLSFLRDLVVSGVELVTSDAHQGLREAIATVFAGPEILAVTGLTVELAGWRVRYWSLGSFQATVLMPLDRPA